MRDDDDKNFTQQQNGTVGHFFPFFSCTGLSSYSFRSESFGRVGTPEENRDQLLPTFDPTERVAFLGYQRVELLLL